MKTLLLVETPITDFNIDVVDRKNSRMKDSREVIMRVQAAHDKPAPLQLLAMEFAYVSYTPISLYT
jgi:hypothetical protein